MDIDTWLNASLTPDSDERLSRLLGQRLHKQVHLPLQSTSLHLYDSPPPNLRVCHDPMLTDTPQMAIDLLVPLTPTTSPVASSGQNIPHMCYDYTSLQSHFDAFVRMHDIEAMSPMHLSPKPMLNARTSKTERTSEWRKLPTPAEPEQPLKARITQSCFSDDQQPEAEQRGVKRKGYSRKPRSTDGHGNKIKRPRNAFIIYRTDNAGRVKKARPDLPFTELSRFLGEMWRNETPEVREKYNQLAEEEKANHAKMYPDFKFLKRDTNEIKRRNVNRAGRT